MEEIKVSEMLQADSIEKDNAVMIIQDGVNKKASGSIQTATGTSLTLSDSVCDTATIKSNSKNVFDQIQIVNPPVDGNGRKIQLTLKPNTQYTMSTSCPTSTQGSTLIFFAAGTSIDGLSTWTNGVWDGQTRTFTSDANGNMVVAYRRQTGDENINLTDYWYQIEEGSTATSYNPYNTEVGIYGKNLINSSLFKQGDFSGSNTTTRLVIGQKLYLRAGTYTISTNLDTNVYRYYINTLEGQIGSTYGSQKYNSNWQTSSPFTFTLSSSQEGYFAFIVGKIDGSILLAQEMANYSFQLENGSTATTYEKFEGQYLTLTPNETKSAFIYDSLTNILSNGSVTIEYNTQSRLLNNDDTTAIKEYVDRETELEILWENPNSNVAFAGQDISLKNSNYKYLEVLFVSHMTNEKYLKSTGLIPKGNSITLDNSYIQKSYTSTIRVCSRLLTYTNDSTLHANNAFYASSFSSSSENNEFCIPIKVIGHK